MKDGSHAGPISSSPKKKEHIATLRDVLPIEYVELAGTYMVISTFISRIADVITLFAGTHDATHAECSGRLDVHAIKGPPFYFHDSQTQTYRLIVSLKHR